MSANTTLDADRNPFGYELIDESSFRLLALHPGQNEDLVTFHLLHSTLECAPPYEALSYVWGDPTIKIEIFCQSEKVSVTKNLADALQHLRLEKEPRLLWVDAICINQNDLEERSKQVSLMGKIYSRAQSVPIWLGRADEYTERAVALMKKIVQLCCAGSTMDPLALSHHDDVTDLVKRLHWRQVPAEREDWQALSQLWARPWFTRVWVVQEVKLCKTATAHCGLQLIEWSFFVLVSEWFFSEQYDTMSLAADLVLCDPIQPHRMNNVGSDSQASLGELMNSARGFSSTDPKDKVYALASFPPLATEALPLIPDYSSSLSKVYADIVVRDCARYECLSMLTYVDHLHTLDLGFPSWIPRWDRAHIAAPFDFAKYNASGSVPFSFEANVDEGTLQVCGFQLDAVVICSPTMDHKHFVAVEDRLQNNPLFGAIENKPFAFFLEAGLDDPLLLADTLQAGGVNLGPLLSACPPLRVKDLVVYQKGLELAAEGKTLEIHNWTYEQRQSFKRFWLGAGTWCSRRRLFQTKEGHIGLGPQAMQDGDLVVILFGSTMPIVLRSHDKGCHYFLGACYVYGIMSGEAISMFEEDKRQLESFLLH